MRSADSMHVGSQACFVNMYLSSCDTVVLTRTFFPLFTGAARHVRWADECSQQQAVGGALAANNVMSSALLDEFTAAPLSDSPQRFECNGMPGELDAAALQVT